MCLTTGGENLSRSVMQYNYDNKLFSGRVKPFRIIGDPDDLRPDKLSSTVLE